MTYKTTMQFLLFFVLPLSLIVQYSSLINLDNSWLLYVADQVLGGARLNHDIIENNPPLITYLMMIPAVIAKLTGLDIIHIFYAIIALLGVFSAHICGRLSERYYIILAAGIGMFWLPAEDFGQREHISMMLILPYLLYVLSNKDISRKYLLAVSIMAAIGFAIKPYYVLLWAAIVLVDAMYNRKIFKIFALQNWIIGCIIFVYFLYLVFIDTEYIKEVLPYVISYYHGFDNGEAGAVFKNVGSNLMLFQLPFLLVLISNRKIITQEIITFSAAHFVSLVIVLIQLKGWGNHYYPAHFFAILLNVSLLCECHKYRKELLDKVSILLLCMALGTMLVSSMTNNMSKFYSFRYEWAEKKIEILNKYAVGKKFMSLHFNPMSIFPAQLYVDDVEYVGRYPGFWLLPGMYDESQVDLETRFIEYNTPGNRSDLETRFVSNVIADIMHNAPDVVLVTKPSLMKTNHLGKFKFDFLGYFLQEPSFVEYWKNYELLDEIDGQAIYVYKGQRAEENNEEQE